MNEPFSAVSMSMHTPANYGSKENPGKFCCEESALPGEPKFCLLGRDPKAPEKVKLWAYERLEEVSRGTRPLLDLEQVVEALKIADAMAIWLTLNRNPGAVPTWRLQKTARAQAAVEAEPLQVIEER